MTEVASKMTPGFSVADADYPELVLRDGDLVVTFRDWAEQMNGVRFPSCCAVRWQTAFATPLPGERHDEIYEILGSDWLGLHRDQRATEPGEPTRHFRLNFNAWGQLEVLADDMVQILPKPVEGQSR